MHELGLLTGVVSAVERATHDTGATEILAVALRVGTRSGVIPEALVSAWPLATIGTPLETATLTVETVEAAVWCPECQAEHAIDEYFNLLCPECSTPTANLVHGKEFEIKHVELNIPD